MTGPQDVIRAALGHLPVECQYHGTRVEAPGRRWDDGACCSTGRPALARKRAEKALARLERPALATELAAARTQVAARVAEGDVLRSVLVALLLATDRATRVSHLRPNMRLLDGYRELVAAADNARAVLGLSRSN